MIESERGECDHVSEKYYLSPFQLVTSNEKEMDFGYTPPFCSLNFEIKMNRE